MAEAHQPQHSKHIVLVDLVRALAILQVVVYHFYSRWFDASFLVVPDGVAANIARLELFKGGGFLDVIKNILSFLFVYGFMAVNVFLMISGFVLAYSVLKNPEKADKEGFWGYVWKRCKRIIWPLYISILAGIGIILIRNILFPNFAGPFLFDGVDIVKLICVPFLFFDTAMLQRFSGVYWFIPLILQLYLLFPLLSKWLRKVGPWKFIVPIFLITFAYRLYAAYFLDTVPMGVVYPTTNSYSLFTFFLPRLFEFSLGMVFAWWYHQSSHFLQKFRGWWPVTIGLLLTFSGFFLNMYRFGWALSDMVVAPGLFIVLLAVGRQIEKSKKLTKFFLWMSGISYELYLIHDYLLGYFIIPLIFSFPLHTEMWFWILLPVFIILSVLAAAVTREAINRSERLLNLFSTSRSRSK